MTEITRVLKQVFPGLDGPDLEALRQVVVRQRVPAGTVICREGATEHEFYIITDGSVSITKQFEDGEERILAIQGPGNFFGEMALVEDKPRAATVTALVETELLSITEQTFTRVVRRNPIVALTVLRHVSNSLRRADRLTIVDLQRKNQQLRMAYEELQAAQAQLIEKQRLERELEIAAEVQRSMLPKRFPDVPGFQFAARTHPARRVGGDFYDICPVRGGKIGVLMADVSGKSVHAAIFMAITRSLFLTEARRSESPRDVVEHVHELLMEIAGSDGMFVTAFYAVIDPATKQMRYTRAGHDRPLLYRGGDVSVLPGEGRFLGLFDGLWADERQLPLQPGDLVVLYSDGVTDAVNPSGEKFGLERLTHLVCKHAGASAETLCNTIIDTVLQFQENAAQFDDQTLQIIRVKEGVD